ncbi:MAG: hypothetical protein M3409_00145, partial [Gemmatimonadota bacterium]|nr:hypothetical protein [Gemmatimonadota bacterium]
GFGDEAGEVEFSPIFDRRVNSNLVVRYLLPWKVEGGARLNWGSGLPYTRPVAAYDGWEYDLPSGRYLPAGSRGPGDQRPVVVLGDRNTERYPAYRRVDLTLRRTFLPRWGSLTPYVQVLNVSNERNVLFYFYRYDRTPPTRSGLSMFPLLPTLGVEASF